MNVLDTPQSPAPPLPADACDTHVHLFGPAGRYPYAPGRSYSPPDALPADLDALHRHLGITRTVLVQASPYGTDNTRLVDALRERGGSARGIVVVRPETDPGALRAMDEAGVRGVRVNLSVNTTNDLEAARDRIRATVRTVAALGWHLDLNTDAATLTALSDVLTAAPVPVVLDHFGGVTPGSGTFGAALRTLGALLRTGHVWVKLSAPYRVTGTGDYADLAPVLDTVMDTRADRALWGSDWPHTGGTPADRDPARVQPYVTVDDGASLSRFAAQLGPERLRQVLVDNPAALYGM